MVYSVAVSDLVFSYYGNYSKRFYHICLCASTNNHLDKMKHFLALFLKYEYLNKLIKTADNIVNVDLISTLILDNN